MKRWLAFVPLAALAVLVVAAIVLLTRGGERETVSAGLLGRPAPAYTLAPLNGETPVSSQARAGRPYVINLFASWCVPCRAEHPQLMALEAAGVEIVGVAYKDRPENAARFLDDLGNPFAAVGLDPEGRFGLDLGLAGVPETFVIGADGTVRAVHRGPLTPEIVEEEILPALQADG
ncbi:MAG: DsbE family thiol:disulfide interchange protein [Hyphomonadaceae bacterium]